MMTLNAAGGKDVRTGRDAPFVPFAFAGGSCNVRGSAPSTAPAWEGARSDA
jgi:hypothetical protein